MWGTGRDDEKSRLTPDRFGIALNSAAVGLAIALRYPEVGELITNSQPPDFSRRTSQVGRSQVLRAIVFAYGRYDNRYLSRFQSQAKVQLYKRGRPL